MINVSIADSAEAQGARGDGGHANGTCRDAPTSGPVALSLEEAAKKWAQENAQDSRAHAPRVRALTPGTGEGVTTRHQASLSESDLAEWFVERHVDELRYCAAWGKWLRWDGLRWKVEPTLLALDRAHRVARDAATDLEGAARAKVANAHTAHAIQTLARADRRIAATVDQWDRDPWLLNTPSGIVDLRTGKISANKFLQYMTRITGCDVDSDCDCPTWRAFLERIFGGDGDLIDYVQRVLGYTLTGDTSEHAMFFGYGNGANGKSVLMNTAAGVLGDYHRSAPIETFTVSSSERHPTELARLRGARLVTAVETEEGRRWAESRIKALTGGDAIAARFMRQDFFEFRPHFKLFVAGNHRPGLRSVDEAIRRRFNLIPFAVTIPPDERDPMLAERLRDEWPGILAWMIDGCLAWQERGGLSPPKAVTEATAQYLEAEDAIAAWLQQCCRQSPSASCPSGDLYVSWRAWAEQAGEKAGSQKRFSQTLEARGFERSRTKDARRHLGLEFGFATAG